MDHEKVIGYVKEAVGAAIADLSPAKAGFRRIKVQKVKVIGREALEKLCMLPDMVTYRAKLTVIPLYAATFLFLMLILLIV
jgi:predicted neutral ceramidase superfamily lipid hydrolase